MTKGVKCITRQNSNFFLSLLENSTDLVSIIDTAGVYKFVSGSVKSKLGFEPEEMVGTSAFEYIHPDDQLGAAAVLEQVPFHKVTILPNFRFRTKCGMWRWMECYISNMVDNKDIQGYVTNTRDITERVEEEERKKKSQAHYESLFYNHPDAVFELDKDGYFCKLNRRVSEVSGCPDNQILGSHFSKFVHSEYLELTTDAFANALDGHAQQLEVPFLKVNGETAFLGITIVPVLLAGNVESLQCIAKDITNEKKFDAFEKKRIEQINSIMERIPESFYSLDHNWCFSYVNNYFATYLNMSKESLLGENVFSLFPAATTTRFYPECMRVAQTGTPSFFEVVFDNEARTTLNFHIFPTGKGLSVHFVDVTKKKREQDKLEKLSLVASKTTTCVTIMDQQGRIEWVNEAFENVTGYSLHECYNKCPDELLVREVSQAKLIARIRKRMANGRSFNGEILNYTKSGEKLWFYLEVTPVFDDEGQLTKFISIRTDITERKQKEQELMEATRALFKKNSDLQEFSYMVSHNLRSPAANILGLSYILQNIDRHSATFDEALLKMNVSVHKLDNVIRDMNNILTLKDDSNVVDKAELVVAEVLQEAMQSIDCKLQSCRHSVTLQVDPTIRLYSNRVYLFETLKILLANAIKFRQQEEEFRLEVNLQQKGGKTELQVIDNGIGMDMGVVKNDIFKLYKKFHRGYQGRGIGLFLVKTYLDALGGGIAVSSQPGKGTVFTIRFKADEVLD